VKTEILIEGQAENSLAIFLFLLFFVLEHFKVDYLNILI